MIAYVAPSIVAIGVTGGLVSRFGYYVRLRSNTASISYWRNG
jgi:hypothetical protein